MKKNIDRQASEKSITKIAAKTKSTSTKKRTGSGPEEFEEQRSMNIRMKPQPLKQPGNKSGNKK